MEQKIGIDSAVFIYLLEENEEYLARAEKVLRTVQEGKVHAVLSVIGLIEILVGPKKQGHFELASQYQELITGFPHLTIAGINERVVELSSDIRARYGVSMPDAIHVATAVDFGAKKFYTNDKVLRKIKEVQVEIL